MDKATRNFAKVLWILFVTGFLTACYDNSDCANNFADSVRIRFLKVQDNSAVPKALDLLEVRALNANQILFDTATSTASALMSFPVNPYRDTTIFILEQPEHTDTILIVYERRPILINPECGMTQIINIDTVLSSFDSVSVFNPALRYNRDTTLYNIEIYY